MELATPKALDRFLYTIDGLVIFRKGPVPSDLDSLGFDYTDVPAIVNDPNLISVSRLSKTYQTTLSGAVGFNSTEQVPQDFAISYLRGKWLLPAKISMDEIRGDASLGGKLVYGDSTLGIQRLARHCIHMPTVYGGVGNATLQGEYLTPTTNLEVILDEPAEVSNISLGGRYYSSRRTSGDLPDYVELEYLNGNDEWVELIPYYRTTSNQNLTGFYHKVLTVARKSYSNSYYDYMISCLTLDAPMLMKGIRIKANYRAGNDDLCSIGYVNLHSDTKPDNVSTSDEVTHALIYPTEEDPALGLKPMIQEIGNLNLENPGYATHGDIPDIDYSYFGFKGGQI